VRDVGKAGKEAAVADDDDARRQVGVAQPQADLRSYARRLARSDGDDRWRDGDDRARRYRSSSRSST
jgi:hypothetical protein